MNAWTDGCDAYAANESCKAERKVKRRRARDKEERGFVVDRQMSDDPWLCPMGAGVLLQLLDCV
jgi:hypothetical protein